MRTHSFDSRHYLTYGLAIKRHIFHSRAGCTRQFWNHQDDAERHVATPSSDTGPLSTMSLRDISDRGLCRRESFTFRTSLPTYITTQTLSIAFTQSCTEAPEAIASSRACRSALFCRRIRHACHTAHFQRVRRGICEPLECMQLLPNLHLRNTARRRRNHGFPC